MLLELFIFLQILVVVLFGISFYTKNEITWSLTIIFSAILMFSSLNVEFGVYEFNTSINAYVFGLQGESFIYMAGVNTVFFLLGLVLFLFDIYDKYGQELLSKSKF